MEWTAVEWYRLVLGGGQSALIEQEHELLVVCVFSDALNRMISE